MKLNSRAMNWKGCGGGGGDGGGCGSVVPNLPRPLRIHGQDYQFIQLVTVAIRFSDIFFSFFFSHFFKN